MHKALHVHQCLHLWEKNHLYIPRISWQPMGIHCHTPKKNYSPVYLRPTNPRIPCCQNRQDSTRPYLPAANGFIHTFNFVIVYFWCVKKRNPKTVCLVYKSTLVGPPGVWKFLNAIKCRAHHGCLKISAVPYLCIMILYFFMFRVSV